MFAIEGRDAETVKTFAQDLAAHGGSPKAQVKTVCCDMSPAFTKGITEYLAEHLEEEADTKVDPATSVVSGGAVFAADTSKKEVSDLHHPQIIFDRYHVVAKANEALDGAQEPFRAHAISLPRLAKERVQSHGLST